MNIPLEQLLATFGRYQDIIDDWDAFLDALRRPLPSVLWTNTLRADAQELERWMDRLGLARQPLGWCPGAWRARDLDEAALGATFPYMVGLCHLQEEVSLLPSYLLDPQPHERILDTCAAPGGKTAHIAVQMGLHGTVVANDKSFGRLRALRAIVDRLGLIQVTMTSWDATSLPREMGRFDRVLADVPCSCEGTSRKNGAVVDQGIVRDFEPLAKVQRAILRRALQLVRPGGRVVYSTCSYAPEENELVVHEVLTQLGQGGARIIPAPRALPGLRHQPGLTWWAGRALLPELRHALRVYPHHQDSGGFFVAVLERLPEPTPEDGRPDEVRS